MRATTPRVCRALACALLCAGMHGAVRCQSDGTASEDEAPVEVSAKERSQAARAALDAKALAVRAQLETVSDGVERFRLLEDLAQSYRRAGRVPESLKIGDEIVEDSRIGAGQRSLRASALAMDTGLIGDFPKSQRFIARAKSLAVQTKPDEIDQLAAEPAYAFLTAEAEIARRANNRHDLALAKTREKGELAWTNFNDASFSEKRHRAAANELLGNVNLHVRLLVQNNRADEALSFVTEIRQRIAVRTDLRATPRQLASINDAMSIAQAAHDDYDAALAEIDKALATYVRIGAPEFELGYGLALRMRLMVALASGRILEYGKDADALLRGRAVNPIVAGAFGAGEPESLALATRGDWAAAAARIAEQSTQVARRQGTESPFYKYQSAMHLLYLLADPARPVPQSEIEQYVATLATDDGDWAGANFRGAYVEDGALSTSMAALVSPRTGTPSESGIALAFRIAEVLRSSSSQGALADGASRLAAGNSKLRALIEQEQVLRFELNSSRRTFANATDRAARAAKQDNGDEAIANRRASDLADKQKQFESGTGKLRQLRKEISAQFPVYRELISSSIPDAAKIGAALRPGEAYLNLYSGPTEGDAFVVLPGGKLTATRLNVTRPQTRALIQALRKPFDAGVPPEKAGDLGGFDLGASNALYGAWLAPLQGQLQGVRTLYVSAGGVLSQVPWNVLTTQPAKSVTDASWWVAQVTPVQMPSASSLLLIRRSAAKGAARPFEAFADPSFDGLEHAGAPVATTRAVRERPLRSAPIGMDAIDYRSLNRLPETLDEVNAIAVSLNADGKSVIDGTQASRTRAMKEDLSDVRVVAFATHGLLPGEVPGMLKAGLALAYEGKGLADSVLTIDDIVGLRLNADWVILSACNTGFASGAAGDSMSALSRGFFAAGARTVLGTSWAVESQSAKELTVGLFKTMAANPSATKGEALAQTQRDMIAGKYGALYRHPYFWAPYFISGDAAR